MTERPEDEPIFGQEDVDPWLEALDNVLQKQKQEAESTAARPRARGTTPPPGVPYTPLADATVVTPALEPLPALPVDESAPALETKADPIAADTAGFAAGSNVAAERLGTHEFAAEHAPLDAKPYESNAGLPAAAEDAPAKSKPSDAVANPFAPEPPADPSEVVSPLVLAAESAVPAEPALPVVPPLPATQPDEPAVLAQAPVRPGSRPLEAPPIAPVAKPARTQPPSPPPRPSQPRAARVEEPALSEPRVARVEEPVPPASFAAPIPTIQHVAIVTPAMVHPALPSNAFDPPTPAPQPIANQSATVEPASSPRIESGLFVTRTRVWSFVVDEAGRPIELGSGRFAKAFLGEERWLESKTRFSRPIAIKCLQRGVTGIDAERFQIEKTILEKVQGHPNIIELMGSGESGSPGCHDGFIPPALRDKVLNDFMILELLDGSLEDLLRGARNKRRRDDLLSLPNPERLFRVLDYVLPVATGVEFAHLVRDVCHRDIKPANILVKLPESTLRGSQLKVKLADFNVGNLQPREERLQSVPGTLYFQSPEQATNTFEVLCNCTHGSAEVQLFEDFYIDISRNDGFSLFNHEQQYQVIAADRSRKRILLDRPYAERDEVNVRGQIIKAVGRPADVYSVGALLYYLISGATGNPKALYDSFKRFAEYDKDDETNTVTAFLEHEYKTIASMRAPKPEQATETGAPEVAFEDRFFSYKQYLDGNGELIDQQVMLLVAKAMIRNKPDSYCFAHDLQSTGISTFVHDLLALYVQYGVDPHARYARTTDYHPPRKAGPMRRAFDRLFRSE